MQRSDSKGNTSTERDPKNDSISKTIVDAGPTQKNPNRNKNKKGHKATKRDALLLLKKEVITIKTPGLSAKQKTYESRLLPKHYMPTIMNKRLAWNNELGKQIKKKGIDKGKTSQESTNATKEPQAKNTQSFKYMLDQNKKDIYVVTSFTDWLPMQMKTMRTLVLEKEPPKYEKKRAKDEDSDDDIPESYFAEDDTIKIFAQMTPPGYHYFYFMREKGTIFLSPRFDVVRFKTTNIFLNRI